ncbi:MAG: hypothetical protein IJU37_08485 [Desulfovibrio sp.]|nr:hypothetical protein [Desulfovibrio sp.]
MEFEDTIPAPRGDMSPRILFEYNFDPECPTPLYIFIRNEYEEKHNTWSVFRQHFRPFIGKYPFVIDICDCFDMDAVYVKNYILYNDRPYVLDINNKIYEMTFSINLQRGYNIQKIVDKDNLIATKGTPVAEREALGKLIHYIYPFDCPCLHGAGVFSKYKELGFPTEQTEKVGFSWLSRCSFCGRNWINMKVENKTRSPHAPLVFSGIIRKEKALSLTANDVVNHLSMIGWYYRASSLLSEKILNQSGFLDVFGEQW